MTELLGHIDAPSDAELISRVRGGDLDAYGTLFARHVDASRRLARQLTRGGDSEDLVSDAFTKVMGVLQAGGGPDVAFRAYLLTAVRRLHVDRIRATSRLTTTDDLEPFDPGVPFQDTAVQQFENGAAAKAFASLPERWQLVLWHLEVENQKPADIAPLLGMSANSVSALAYRAREGLRQAFLSAHLAETTEPECRWVTGHLGGYVRRGLAKRDNAKIESHLEECRSCTAMYLELTEVNSNLRGIIGPLLLGALAAGYASSAGGAAGVGGLVGQLGRAKDFAKANLTPVVAGTAAASVAVATVMAVVISGGDADSPVAAPRSPAATDSVDGVAAEDRSADDVRNGVTGAQQRQQPTLRRIASPSPGTSSPSATPSEPTPIPTAPTPTASAAPEQSPEQSTQQPPPPAGGQPPAGQPDEDRPGTGQPSDTPSGSPSPSAAPDPTQPPPAPRTADVTVSSMRISEDNAIVVEVGGLPDQQVTILVDLSSSSGRTSFATPSGACQVIPANRGQARCTTGAARTATTSRSTRQGQERRGFHATLPLAFPDDLRDDRLRVEVHLVGYREADSRDNARSVDFTPHRPPPPPPVGRDITLALASNGVGRGIGRFRAHVLGLDGGGGDRRTPLLFRVELSDSRVDLERIPHHCRYVDDQRSLVACTGHGSRYAGIFDLNLRRLERNQTVTVKVTVSIPGVPDPRPADNTGWITLKLPGHRLGGPR